MANIGRVYTESYTNSKKEEVKIITLDIRTITFRKKFSISVNKNKYPDGVVNKNIAQGKENHPDYHIWYNVSNRGESLPSVIVGNVSNAVSENGLAYKKGKIFDPFLSRYNIYFTLFSVDADKKIDKDHLYNVVAEAYKKPTTNYYDGANAMPAYQSESNAPHTYETTYETIDKEAEEAF